MNDLALKKTEDKNISVANTNTPKVEAFSSMSGFEVAQRMAKALSESDLVPQIYRGKMPNCLVALEISQRCQASVLMVMQNLYVIQGKPSWSSQYIIAAVNACGKFSPIRFKMEGTEKCTAFAIELSTGETLEGPAVTMAMAKAEGWIDKSGSKWKTMPELMMRYRAAAFFGRLYAPEVLMGLQTREEHDDSIVTTGTEVKTSSKAEELRAKLSPKKETIVELEAPAPLVVEPGEFADYQGGAPLPEDPKVVK